MKWIMMTMIFAQIADKLYVTKLKFQRGNHMRKIEEKGKWDSLDPLQFEQISEHAEELLEASNLLYEVINASWKCSRDCLSINVNGDNRNLQDLYWDCKRDMEAAEKGCTKTDFSNSIYLYIPKMQGG